uniref:Conjugal transfer protein n=1 Tax=Streptococcus mitis TaxID=28037 RepID=A0A059VAG4_STRMT|nr:hypothetical protein Tn6227_orf9 [Streptococcus mitis]
MSVCFIKSSFPNHLFGFHKSCFTSNRTALAKLTGISPLHDFHVAVPIVCDATNARTVAIREYHYHDKKVMATILLKIVYEVLT